MGGKSTTSTTTTQLPPEMRQAYSSLINQAQGVYNDSSYTPYPGGSSNSLIDAANSTLQNSGTAGNAAFGASAGALQSALNPAYNSVANYMNPYTSGVVNATMANMNEQNAEQQQSLTGNAIAKGAMGGDRLGVAQAELARQQNLANQQTIAGLWNQNYSQAMQAAQGQQALGLQAANSYNTLGSAESTAAVQSGLAALQGGENQFNRDYSMYQAQQSYPFQKASWLASIVEGLGSSSGGTSTTTSPAGNGLSSLFGGALGLGALFLSDKKAKENIEPVGKLFDGQTLYRYNYKGDPRTQVGLIAQEVEGKHPDAVRSIDGLKGVDYHEATDDAAGRGKFAPGGVIPYDSGNGNTFASGKDMSYVPAPSPIAGGGGGGPPKGGGGGGGAGQQDPMQGFTSGLKNIQEMNKLGKDLGVQKGVQGLMGAGADTGASLAHEATAALGPAAGAVNGSAAGALDAGAGAGAGASGGILSGLLGLFAKGGLVKGYDDGGDVPFDDLDMLRQQGLDNPAQQMPVMVGPNNPNPPAAEASKPWTASRLPDAQDYRPEDSPRPAIQRSDAGVGVAEPPARPEGGVLGIKPTPPTKDNEKGFRPEDSPKAPAGVATADSPYANDPLMNLAARQAGLVTTTPPAQGPMQGPPMPPAASPPEAAFDDNQMLREQAYANPAQQQKPGVVKTLPGLVPEGSTDELMAAAAKRAQQEARPMQGPPMPPKPGGGVVGTAEAAESPGNSAVAGLVPLPPPRPQGQILGLPDNSGGQAAPDLPAPIDVGGLHPATPPGGVGVDHAPKVGGMTAKQADADNPQAPVGRLSAGQQARVAQGLPINVPRLSGPAAAGAQNWLQNLANVGLDHMHAAIMAGNIQTESSFRPDAWNRGENAHGAMQWEGDRWSGPNGLQAFAQRMGRDWREPQVQAAFMKWEGENIPRLRGPWQQFLAAQTPEQAQNALAGFIGYKRDDAHGNDRARLANGMAILGGAPTAVAANSTGNATSNDATGSIPQTGGVVAQNGAAPSGNEGGILGKIRSFLGGSDMLTDDQRMALLSAGLGIMGGTSSNPFVNIGQGGLKGVEQYMQGRNMRRQDALAQSEIGYKAGTLGLEGQRVDLEGKRLAQDAELKRQELAQQSAYQSSEIAKNQAEVAAGRYTVTPGANGFLVTDRYNPLNMRIVTPDELQQGVANGTLPPPQGGGFGAPPAAPAPAPTGPNASGGILSPAAPPDTATAPVAAATPAGPTGGIAAMPPQAAAPAPTPGPMRVVVPTNANAGLAPPVGREPFSANQFNTEGQKTNAELFKDQVVKLRDQQVAAQSTNMQLDQMEGDLAKLPQTGFLAAGPGFGSRNKIAGTVNQIFKGAGMGNWFDPEQVAAGEAAIKGQNQLGFELTRTLGSREAGFIVQQAVATVPGGALSPQGSKILIAAIRAANQRKIDMANYIQSWGQQNGMDTTHAQATFDKYAPPALYTLIALKGPNTVAAVQRLRQHPEMRGDFDALTYPGASRLALGEGEVTPPEFAGTPTQ